MYVLEYRQAQCVCMSSYTCSHAHILDLIQAITKFESLANQIQKNAGDIDERLHMIESVRLFKQPPLRPGCELPEAKVTSSYSVFTMVKYPTMFLSQEYFEFQESYRNGIFNSLSRKYHAIGPLLIKMEGLVVYSNTGKSPRLMHYYSYWERRVYDALVKVNCTCTNSLHAMKGEINVIPLFCRW